MAQLSNTNNTSTTTVNLTTEGTTYWKHWVNSATTVSKSTGSGISERTAIGTYTEGAYTNDPRTITWSDGSPTGSGSDANGVYTGNSVNTGFGFSFTLTADTSVRTANFHFGLFSSSGRFVATLSDGSAGPMTQDFTDPGINISGDCNLQLTFQAASAAQTLTVNWTCLTPSNSFGNVTINGISLAVATAAVSDIPSLPIRHTIYSLSVL